MSLVSLSAISRIQTAKIVKIFDIRVIIGLENLGAECCVRGGWQFFN